MADASSRPLTEAQAETLRLAAQGLSYKQIAHRRHVTVGAVKETLQRVRVKLQVDTTIEAFRAMGWLDVPPR